MVGDVGETSVLVVMKAVQRAAPVSDSNENRLLRALQIFCWILAGFGSDPGCVKMGCLHVRKQGRWIGGVI